MRSSIAASVTRSSARVSPRSVIRVAARLLGQPAAGVDQDHREVGGRGARDHVARVLRVAGAVVQHEAAPRRGEVAVGDVDRDALLALGAQAVGQQCEVEALEVPPIYFAHEREVFQRDGMLYAVSPFVELIDGEEPFVESVRYRTVGDMSCTGAVRSSATGLGDVVAEIAAAEITERGETRADDRVSEAAMEDRKVAGYF